MKTVSYLIYSTLSELSLAADRRVMNLRSLDRQYACCTLAHNSNMD